MTPSPDPVDRIIDRRLAEQGGLDPERRAWLVGRVLAADAAGGARTARRPRRIVLAAAAALALAGLVAIVASRRGEPEPIRPTAILADLVGPFVQNRAVSQHGDPEDDSLFDGAVGHVLRDIGTPLSLALSPLEPACAPPARTPPQRSAQGD